MDMETSLKSSLNSREKQVNMIETTIKTSISFQDITKGLLIRMLNIETNMHVIDGLMTQEVVVMVV